MASFKSPMQFQLLAKERQRQDEKLRLRSLQRGLNTGLVNKLYTNDHITELRNITTEKLETNDEFINKQDILNQVDKALIKNRSPYR